MQIKVTFENILQIQSDAIIVDILEKSEKPTAAIVDADAALNSSINAISLTFKFRADVIGFPLSQKLLCRNAGRRIL